MMISPPLFPNSERFVGVAAVAAAFQPSLESSFLNFAMPADGMCASVKAKTSASWAFSLMNLWGFGPHWVILLKKMFVVWHSSCWPIRALP